MTPAIRPRPGRCIHCGHSMANLIELHQKEYRLSQCDKCGGVADEYVEVEFVVVLLDLLLLREKAFRHLLFNRNVGRGFWTSCIFPVLLGLVLETVVASWMLESGSGAGAGPPSGKPADVRYERPLLLVLKMADLGVLWLTLKIAEPRLRLSHFIVSMTAKLAFLLPLIWSYPLAPFSILVQCFINASLLLCVKIGAGVSFWRAAVLVGFAWSLQQCFHHIVAAVLARSVGGPSAISR